MFCSQCGAEASGNFCASCGAPLTKAVDKSEMIDSSPRGDWSEMVEYEQLIRIPQVRDMIKRHAGQSKSAMSGEDFLKTCDTLLSSPMGVSLTSVALIVQPIYSVLGIKTGKRQTQMISRPVGKVMVSLLCSLARHGWNLKQISQGQDGCVFEATLPSDLWSFEGDVVVSLGRFDHGTMAEAGTVIKGQVFDWGKSSRCLNELFDDMSKSPA